MPDMNTQNGVLKSLSFMFEYIGEMSRVRLWSDESEFSVCG